MLFKKYARYTQESIFYLAQALALYYWINSTEEPKTTQAITSKVLSTYLLACYSYYQKPEKKIPQFSACDALPGRFVD